MSGDTGPRPILEVLPVEHPHGFGVVDYTITCNGCDQKIAAEKTSVDIEMRATCIELKGDGYCPSCNLWTLTHTRFYAGNRVLHHTTHGWKTFRPRTLPEKTMDFFRKVFGFFRKPPGDKSKPR